MTNAEITLAVLTFLVMLAGVAGVIVPGLPDLPLIWAAALVYGLLAGFSGWVGAGAMVVLTVLGIGGIAAELALGPVGARQQGASWAALAAGFVLGLAGLFVFPPIGPIVGALLGVFLVEYYRRKNAPEAWQVVKGYAVGCSVSVVLRGALALAMIGVWAAWVWLANR